MRAYVGGAVMDDLSRPVSGITVVDLDVALVGVTAPTAVNTTYLAARRGADVVNAAGYDLRESLSAWRVAGDQLEPLGSVPADGSRACHLTVHPRAEFVLAAGYRDCTVAVHPVRSDGALESASHVVRHTGSGPDSDRQDGPHTHMVTVDPPAGPDRGDVLAVDLGTDTVHRYRLDEDAGRLVELDMAALLPGTGPRHLGVRGDRAYVAGELASTLSVVDLAAITASAGRHCADERDRGTGRPAATRRPSGPVPTAESATSPTDGRTRWRCSTSRPMSPC